MESPRGVMHHCRPAGRRREVHFLGFTIRARPYACPCIPYEHRPVILISFPARGGRCPGGGTRWSPGIAPWNHNQGAVNWRQCASTRGAGMTWRRAHGQDASGRIGDARGYGEGESGTPPLRWLDQWYERSIRHHRSGIKTGCETGVDWARAAGNAGPVSESIGNWIGDREGMGEWRDGGNGGMAGWGGGGWGDGGMGEWRRGRNPRRGARSGGADQNSGVIESVEWEMAHMHVAVSSPRPIRLSRNRWHKKTRTSEDPEVLLRDSFPRRAMGKEPRVAWQSHEVALGNWSGIGSAA
jgi:hypothetical protein